MNRKQLLVRGIAPVLAVVLGMVLTLELVASKKKPEAAPPEVERPLVEVAQPLVGPVRLEVRTQGTVVPRTESRLVAEVSGRVVAASPALASGGFFEEGETLIALDSVDYELAVARAEEMLAAADLRLAQETADAERARKDWESSARGDVQRASWSEAPPLVRREPQLAEARAARAAAEAAVRQARRDVERCRLRAPFRGRVRSKAVDVGQYVPMGTTLATLYAVDYAEVRLPLPDADLAFLDLPFTLRENLRAGDPTDGTSGLGTDGTNGTDGTDGMGHGSPAPHAAGPEVLLRADFAGGRPTWNARIVRTEGELDPESRMVVAVARVEDPYGIADDQDRAPLLVGMFVEAEILGLRVPEAIQIPRTALRPGGVVWVVGAAGRLEIRGVDVLRAERERVLLRAGLARDERVVVSPLEAVVDGMEVRVQGGEPAR